MDDNYGIDRAHAHPRALELVPNEDDFFWSNVDELAPFGSDEGDTALAEYRSWRKKHPRAPLEKCLIWTIESVGEMKVRKYNDAIFEEATVEKQVADEDFDDQQYIYTLYVSVIATGFGQLVDEGRIDAAAKPYIARALKRQIVWAKLAETWEHAGRYIRNLQRLEHLLEKA
jgi:uncharacterized protein YfeS